MTKLKQYRFWTTHVDRKWTFCIIGRWFCPNFEQVASVIVKKLSNTNLLASKHIKREKTSLPIDMRHSKTPLLQGVPLLLLLSIEKISFSQSSSSQNLKVFINSLLIKPNFFALHSSIIYSSLLFIFLFRGTFTLGFFFELKKRKGKKIIFFNSSLEGIKSSSSPSDG